MSNENKNFIQLDGKLIDKSEFDKIKEDIEKNKTKKLKKIRENEYKILEKMYG
ncbi:MAG: hypothetical protein N2169_06520 [bacterium]|nr:hypothetical protein [bacterium]